MQNDEIKISDYVTVREASEILNCSAVKIYNFLEKLQHKKIGNTVFLYKPSLIEMINNETVKEFLPSRADWDRLKKHLLNSGEDRVVLSIAEIVNISGSNSSALNTPGSWDPNNATKRRTGAYSAMIKAGYDLAQMKFEFSREFGQNVISEITFKKVESKNRSDNQALSFLNADLTIAEQRGLAVPSYSRIFVNFDTAMTRVHVDCCYYVKNFIRGGELPINWQAYHTLADAESDCVDQKKLNWRHCLRCFKKKGGG